MKLTPEEYCLLCIKTNSFIAKGLRKGQSYMNALHEVNPTIYQNITGTDIDPFYDDAKIAGFLACILS